MIKTWKSRSQEEGSDDSAGGSNGEVDCTDQDKLRRVNVGTSSGSTNSDPDVLSVFGFIVDGTG